MRSRGGHIVIGGLGLAVVVLAVLLVGVSRQATSNDGVIRRLAGAVAAERQAELSQLRLIRALQQQVRDCRKSRRACGPPLTRAPTPRTPPGTTAPPTGPASSAPSSPEPTRQPRPTRSPRPSPTPRPTSSPTPSPSPTPTCGLTHPLRCLPGA